MDPQQSFCPNEGCPARGHTARGNIRIHCRTRKRLRCTVCDTTFSHRRGTPFLALKTDPAVVALVVALVAHGCPIPAIEAAFRVQRRTVRAWVERAGTHCHAVHDHLVLQPQVLHHVQADEVFVRAQHGAPRRGSRHRWLYFFSAICVSTRLWLGGVVSPKRDLAAAAELAAMVRRAALPGPLLVVVDGFRAYVAAFTCAFRVPLRTGRRGRPRLLASASLVLVQHVKQSSRVFLAHGTWEQFTRLWRQVGGLVVATSYVERLNATFRERLAPLARRSRHLVRTEAALEASVYLLGTVYNFCWVHRSLGRTPAMAAGLVTVRWRVADLLWYHVPPARWHPPPHRGPLSKREVALLAEWGT
jgi:transposase-like protein